MGKAGGAVEGVGGFFHAGAGDAHDGSFCAGVSRGGAPRLYRSAAGRKAQPELERRPGRVRVLAEHHRRHPADQAPAEADQMQFHKGLDIAAAYGSDVMCAAQGKVIFAGQKGGYGNCVIVEHGNGLATLYGHLSKVLVKAKGIEVTVVL